MNIKLLSVTFTWFFAQLSFSQTLYWADYGAGTISFLNLNTAETPTVLMSGLDGPAGIEIVGNNIYWINQNTNSIGRANLDGSGINKNFIPTRESPLYLLHHDGYFYWSNYAVDDVGRDPLNSSIGRSLVDGTNVDQFFIPQTYFGQGLGTDGTYLYWGNAGSPATLGTGTVGRATLSGEEINNSFVTGLNRPTSVLFFNNLLYVTDGAFDSRIINVYLDGTRFDTPLIETQGLSTSLAIDGVNIFWNSEVSGLIGRADLDGNNVNITFISGLDSTGGLFVIPEARFFSLFMSLCILSLMANRVKLTSRWW